MVGILVGGWAAPLASYAYAFNSSNQDRHKNDTFILLSTIKDNPTNEVKGYKTKALQLHAVQHIQHALQSLLTKPYKRSVQGVHRTRTRV